MEQLRDVGILIKVIHDTISTKANARLRQYDITLGQARVLRLLFKSENAVSIKTLEQYFRVKHSTMNGILGRLEAKELVRITVNDRDKRFRDVWLTETGAKIDREMFAKMREDESRLTYGFTAQETETLRALLLRAYNNIAET